MAGRSCPTCGEAQALSGRQVGDDIEITCDACGTRFLRGERRCQSCGASGAVEADQQMTRHPRGNMLAVVGMRRVPLCPECDQVVLETALAQRRPVPEGYVSRFLFGKVEAVSLARTAPPRRTGPRVTRPEDAQAAPLPRPVGPAERPRGSARPVDPTVRQATEQFLLQAEQPVDSVALVMLGSFLEPSVRVSSLDTPRTQAAVAEWFADRWGTRSARKAQERARETLVALADYWQSRGWVSLDLASGLRPRATDLPTS